MALTKIGAGLFKDTLKTNVSGALGDNATLIRSLTEAGVSGSFSQTHLSSKISGIISGAAQLPSGVVSASVLSSPSQGTIRLATNGVNNDVDSGLQAADSPTFAGGTVTGNLTVGGTLTAQEIHTEFTSASIMFSSGSTKFGDTIDDTHEVTGSMTMSGSVTVNDGALTVTDNVDFNGDLDVDGTTNLDVVDIDGAVDMASTLTVANQTFIGGTADEGYSLLLNIEGAGGTDDVPGILFKNTSASNDEEIMSLLGTQGSDSVAAINIKREANADDAYIDFMTQANGGSMTERMRIDSSGKLGIGASSPTGKLSIAGTSGVQSNIYVDNHAGDQDSANFIFRKSRNTSIGSHTVVQDDDDLGSILFQGSDGNSYETGAQIVAEVDGTPGDGDMPGRLVFKTTADGASSASERIRITNAGLVGIGTNNPAKVFHVEASVSSDFVSRIRNSHSSGEALNIKTNNTNSQFRLLHAENSNGRVFTIFNDAKTLIGNNDGFSAASASLHIAQNEPTIRLQDMNHASDTYVQFNANSSAASLEIEADGANKKSGTTIDFRIDGDGIARLDNFGNLGIGPAKGFAGGVGFTSGTHNHRGGGNSTTLHISGSIPRILLEDSGDDPSYVIEAQDYFAILEAANDGTSETTRFRIKNDGNVGIGTTNPRDKLDVVGDININGSGTRQIKFDDGSESEGAIVFDEITDGFIFKVGGTSSSGKVDALSIANTGDVGIGESNPDGKLTVNHGANDTGHIVIKNSDVAHSFTSLFANDTFVDMRKYSNAEGGLNLQGISEGERGLALSNFSTVYDTPSNGTAVDKGFQFFAYALSGTNAGNINSNGTAYIFRVRRGDASPAVVLIDEDGDIHADGSTSITGYDYAEMFECEDGNTGEEDRVGYSVVFGSSGDKIRIASGSEEPIGVVSARPGVIGDNPLAWQGKWKTDEWDRKIPKLIPMVSWSFDYTRGNGEVVQKTFRTEIAHTGSFLSNIPSGSSERGVPYGGSIPSNANYYNKEESQLADDYDETRDYTTRRGRGEWDTIGLMGKLKIRTGQATGSRWIKMKDVSDSIQLWLVK